MNKLDALNELDDQNIAGGLCETCKEDQPSTRMRLDPYQSDVNNCDVEVYICDECAYQKSQDI